ncbi:prenyltransferase/squalene oxidase repeat-containing protein [Streptomyces sp. SP17KL33]|uniref:prenyltransferase/squalene oxidase repeat-containing protein n=1 Tax=Streptomyces sp. SP17KL33 TaxID=3002534 RepID=UPI002E77EA82|nr:prenyltransferase/squalene oxidase repeat-containing protein [Streptomyces sp. SP17KL33]MEE1835708.1 prenyltransferase/squalene oxidase repeat-containing protein [Streptomyces sp. SP17KL33]
MNVTSYAGLRDAAQDIVDEMIADPYGLTSPSVYETARMVASAPWLEGHRQRVEFLLAQQHEDGTWGGPAAYGLLPTLSAVDALLSVAGTQDARRVAGAVESGLAALTGRFPRNVELPDTIAVELLVPWLIEQIDQRLSLMDDRGDLPGRLDLRADTGTLSGIRELLRQHTGIPEKTWHSLEALGAPAVRSGTVTPMGGAVGASPAATAAWLGDPPHTDAAKACLEYLRQTQARHGGPVSGITSITYFEVAWVVTALSGSGLDVDIPAQVADTLRTALGANGLSAGPGLPADSDDTSAALHALDLLGKPESVDCLWEYDTGLYFTCFPKERTPSTSTNAHILVALADRCGQGDTRYDRAAERVGGWLVEQQQPDGRWTDKWHASPYYATACGAAAMARLDGPRTSAALDDAIRWVLDTQHADGSWGRWEGTGEETAYALQVLNHRAAPDRPALEAIRAGRAFLSGHVEDDRENPPLWHDKDLYTPVRVIRAEILGTLSATRRVAETEKQARP